jgi:hypothetical protein
VDKILRRLKMEYLLSKRERASKIDSRNTELFKKLSKDSFRVIAMEIVYELQMQLKNKSKHGLKFGEPSLVLDTKDSINYEILKLNALFDKDDFLLVIPFDWEIYGGIIINRDILFTNFSQIAYILEDGMYILNDLIERAVKIRLERQLGNYELTYMEMSEL